jgi:glycosyltransferase involved in cell wall biosynthesis
MNIKMKALYITRTFYPEGFGGGEISALHIVKSISKKVEPIVCCLSEKISKPILQRTHNIKIYRFPWKKLRWFKKLSNLDYANYQLYNATKKIINKEKPDIIHLLNTDSTYFIANKIKNIPKFATINGPLFCEFGGSHPNGKSCYNCSNKERFLLSFKKWGLIGLFYWIYNRRSQYQLKKSLKNCRKIFPVSNAIKKMLVEKGISKSKIEIIHNPISTTNIKPNLRLKKELNISKNKKIIFYAGRLAKNKGIHFTIKAIKDLENVVFLIAGKKRDYYDELIQLTKKLKIEDKVKFLGFINNDKITEYFSITDLVVHPCFFYEPLSRMLIEATNQGLPIVASNIGGNSEIVENNKNGYLIENNQELKEKISKLINDNKLLKKFGENSKKIAKNKFSYKQISEKLIKEYLVS